MSNISKAFENGKAFIAFLTAGDPNLIKTEEYILTMAKAGADLIEIGIPFSDPIAEGKVIAKANVRALSSGTTVKHIFNMVKNLRKKTDVPLAFLTYINTLFSYGYERFFNDCKEAGVDAIIIPDLPFEEQIEILVFADKYDVDIISMIAPTSDSRIVKIAQRAKGFIYLVSSLGVTGIRNEINSDINGIVKLIRLNTKIPVAVGFGIYNTKQAKDIAGAADGIIVGSAIVKIIEQYGESASEHLGQYVKEMKKAANSYFTNISQ